MWKVRLGTALPPKGTVPIVTPIHPDVPEAVGDCLLRLRHCSESEAPDGTNLGGFKVTKPSQQQIDTTVRYVGDYPPRGLL
jgi:hypothetical protein